MQDDNLIAYLYEKIKEFKSLSELIKKNITVSKEKKIINAKDLSDQNELFKNLEKKREEIDEIFSRLKKSPIYDESAIKTQLSILEETVINLIINRKKDINELELIVNLIESLDKEVEKLRHIGVKIKENLILIKQKEGKNIEEERKQLDNLLSNIKEINNRVEEISKNIPETLINLKDRANSIIDKASSLLNISIKEIERIELIVKLRESLDNEFEKLKRATVSIKDSLNLAKQNNYKEAGKETLKLNELLNAIETIKNSVTNILHKIPESIKWLKDRAVMINEKAVTLSDISLKELEKIKSISGLREAIDNEFEQLRKISVQMKEIINSVKQKTDKDVEDEINQLNGYLSTIEEIRGNVSTISLQTSEYVQIFKNRISKITENAETLQKICEDEIKKKSGYKKFDISDIDIGIEDFGKTFEGLDIKDIKPLMSRPDAIKNDDFGKTFEGLESTEIKKTSDKNSQLLFEDF